jgi:alkanesulfonate monooxygenase SsuD/methylene tetrahydromethanopterin reductase-like flavin-dependent oxidoreductase (luciferase family)
MHVGTAVIFQNTGRHTTDQDVYHHDVRLAEMAEPMGFESVWTVEHHFTDYTMSPDPLQFLTYMAGRTEHVKLGTMVVVLPWHDPLRVAEQVSVLDNLSGGRLILGLGRGAGRVEFDGFRQDMQDSRPRFIESAQMVLEGLEQGFCEFEGEFVKQPRVELRPAPCLSFKGRTYAAAVSPESVEIMARLGLGLLVIPQKPWDAVEQEIEAYRVKYREINGEEPPAPIMAGWVMCDPDLQRAREMAVRYIGGYWQTVLDHYRFHEDHLKGQKGYEYYGRFAESIQEQGVDNAVEFFLNLQVWGDPDKCFETIAANAERLGAQAFVGVFSYAGMPWDEAERNMTCFAEAVMPRLQGLPLNGKIDWAA